MAVVMVKLGGSEEFVTLNGDLVVDGSGNFITANTPSGSNRLLTNTASVAWDFNTTGEAKADVI